MKQIRTIIVDNMEDLEKLKGSKYIQSYTEEAFNKVIDIAKKDTDKRFLVFGTPCQKPLICVFLGYVNNFIKCFLCVTLNIL